MKLCELLIVLGAALSPIFFLAAEIDGDEFAKSISGVVAGGCVAACLKMYSIWTGVA